MIPGVMPQINQFYVSHEMARDDGQTNFET